MVPRDTSTGRVLERMVLPALQKGNYFYRTNQPVGRRPGGGRNVIDVVAKKGGRTILVSLKWQQTSGTAEQKIPYEVICLAEAVRSLRSEAKAYLVLGGSGWTLREFYVSGGLRKYLKNVDQVEILTLDDFVAAANAGRL
jgi:hypothetical protein